MGDAQPVEVARGNAEGSQHGHARAGDSHARPNVRPESAPGTERQHAAQRGKQVIRQKVGVEAIGGQDAGHNRDEDAGFDAEQRGEQHAHCGQGI